MLASGEGRAPRVPNDRRSQSPGAEVKSRALLLFAARSLNVSEPWPAGGTLDAGERMQPEPLREAPYEMLGAFELDVAPAERRGQAGVSHPHGGQALRVAAHGEVDAESRIA